MKDKKYITKMFFTWAITLLLASPIAQAAGQPDPLDPATYVGKNHIVTVPAEDVRVVIDNMGKQTADRFSVYYKDKNLGNFLCVATMYCHVEGAQKMNRDLFMWAIEKRKVSLVLEPISAYEPFFGIIITASK